MKDRMLITKLYYSKHNRNKIIVIIIKWNKLGTNFLKIKIKQTKK